MPRPAKKANIIVPVDPKKPEKAEIPLIVVKQVEIPIIGLEGSPLVVNAWSEKAKSQMRDKQQGKAQTKKEPKDPAKCFEAAKYKFPNGDDALKACFFKSAMVAAARFVEGVNMTMMRMSVFVKGDLIPFEFEHCNMREDMVRNESGVSDIRYRPEYIDWSTTITVQYFSPDLQLSQILLMLRQAGMRVGICEGRPEKSPSLGWGRFDIDMKKLGKGKDIEAFAA